MLYLAKHLMVQEGCGEYIILHQFRINLCCLTSLTQLLAHHNATIPAYSAFEEIFFAAYLSQEIP